MKRLAQASPHLTMKRTPRTRCSRHKSRANNRRNGTGSSTRLAGCRGFTAGGVSATARAEEGTTSPGKQRAADTLSVLRFVSCICAEAIWKRVLNSPVKQKRLIRKDTRSVYVNETQQGRDLYADLYRGTENTLLPLKVNVQFLEGKLHAPHSAA